MGTEVVGLYEKPRCPNCNSTMVYFRQKTKEFVCNRCGFIEKIDEKEEEGK